MDPSISDIETMDKETSIPCSRNKNENLDDGKEWYNILSNYVRITIKSLFNYYRYLLVRFLIWWTLKLREEWIDSGDESFTTNFTNGSFSTDCDEDVATPENNNSKKRRVVKRHSRT